MSTLRISPLVFTLVNKIRCVSCFYPPSFTCIRADLLSSVYSLPVFYSTFPSVFAIYLTAYLVFFLSLCPPVSLTLLLFSLITFGTSPNLILYFCGAQHSCALLLSLLLQTAPGRQCLVSNCSVAKECVFWRC